MSVRRPSADGSTAAVAPVFRARPQHRRYDGADRTDRSSSMEPHRITVPCDDGTEREGADGETEIERGAIAAHHDSTNFWPRRSGQRNTDGHARSPADCAEDGHNQEQGRMAIDLGQQCRRA